MFSKKKLLAFIMSSSLLISVQAADKVGLTIYDSKDAFISHISKALTDKVRKQNVELISYDSQNNQETQNIQIDNLINSGVKALIINLVDIEAGFDIAAKAKAANIPVIFFNRDPGRLVINSYKKAYYVGADPVQSGIIQGDLVAKGWKNNPSWDLNGDGKLQFVLLKGEPEHPDAEARSEWVMKELLHNDVTAEKLAEAYGNWHEEKAKQIVDTWLKSPLGSQIEVIISNNDAMAIGAIRGTRENGRVIPTYGIDADPRALEMVKNKELAGTVLNDGFSQAWAISQILPSLMLDSTPDEYTGYSFNNRYLRIPYIAIDSDNLKDFANKN